MGAGSGALGGQSMSVNPGKFMVIEGASQSQFCVKWCIVRMFISSVFCLLVGSTSCCLEGFLDQMFQSFHPI